MKQKAIKDYINLDDLMARSGYRTYRSEIGIVGRAMIEACKKKGSLQWLKKQMDTVYKKLRNKRRNGSKKQNSRPNLSSNGEHKS